MKRVQLIDLSHTVSNGEVFPRFDVVDSLAAIVSLATYHPRQNKVTVHFDTDPETLAQIALLFMKKKHE
jgi:hypothetical protein